MLYTVGEMAKRLGIAPSTLRYYDKEGLLPFVERSGGGIRVFKDADYEWLKIIECLKKTGMSLKDIKEFVVMAMQGDETIEPRLSLIVKQKEAVKAQIAELEETLRTLEFKEWYYETAKENGSTDVPRNMTLDELPEQFRDVKVRLRGE
ncbi:MAG: MerR family transcriptional regulator [Clostridia bacterium]|nr:MerR family transcriptional regulator [Clostridia bacterium]